MEANIKLEINIEESKNNKKYFKLALLLALLLNFIILLLLIFYSLDTNHTINFFQAQQDKSTGALPVYFDISGSPQGSPSGTAQSPQNLSVGLDSEASQAAQNLSVGFEGDSSGDNNQAWQKTQSQAYKPGATNPGQLQFGFDDIEGEKADIKNFDKEKAMLKEYLSQEQEEPGAQEEISQDKLSVQEETTSSSAPQQEEILEENIQDNTQENKLEFERKTGSQDKIDLSFWTNRDKILSKNREKIKEKINFDKTKSEPQTSSKTSSNTGTNTAQKKQGQKRVLPKKSGSIFGKELLEGFKNFMQEQKYSPDSQARSISIGTNNNNNNYSGQSSGELGRSVSSQLKGEVNGMLLIKELALASRLDETMVQSDKFIDKVIPFELTIGEHGKVLNVELRESCGSPSVDRHFVKLVYQSSPINHYARHYKGAPFKITLSIRFIVPAGANRLLVTYGEN